MTDAERLRREFGRLFDPGVSDAELAERRRRWVSDLRESWPRMSEAERMEMGDLREFLRLTEG